VDKANWPLNLNSKPEHPWKLTRYLYLLDTATGEFSTFWTDTIGGRVAVDELNDQVESMRQLRPGAHPVVQLRSVPMPTSHGGTKPRPHFKIAGWKQADGAVVQAQIAGPMPTSLSRRSARKWAAKRSRGKTASTAATSIRRRRPRQRKERSRRKSP
jgi:hypothetical protein